MRGTTERRDRRQAAASAAVTAAWLLAAAVQAAGLLPLGLALRDRLKEIKGGELYEARQY